LVCWFAIERQYKEVALVMVLVVVVVAVVVVVVVVAVVVVVVVVGSGELGWLEIKWYTPASGLCR